MRQPGTVTFPERSCLVQKVKGVCFPSDVRFSSCSLALRNRRGKREEENHKVRRGCSAHLPPSPQVPSSLAPPFDSPAPLCSFSDFCSARNALPTPTPRSPCDCYASFKPQLKYYFPLKASSGWISLQCTPRLPLLPHPNLDPTGVQPTVYYVPQG